MASIILKSLVLLMSSFFMLVVIYLLVKQKINERASLPWIIGSVVMMGLAFVPNLLEILAQFTQVHYPPALLFLITNFVILLLVLFQAIQISALQNKCQELVQNLSIIKSTGLLVSQESQNHNKRVIANHFSEEEKRTDLIG